MKKAIIEAVIDLLNENGIAFYTDCEGEITTITVRGLSSSLALEFHGEQSKTHTFNNRELFICIPESVVFIDADESIRLPSNYETVIGKLSSELALSRQAS